MWVVATDRVGGQRHVIRVNRLHAEAGATQINSKLPYATTMASSGAYVGCRKRRAQRRAVYLNAAANSVAPKSDTMPLSYHVLEGNWLRAYKRSVIADTGK